MAHKRKRKRQRNIDFFALMSYLMPYLIFCFTLVAFYIVAVVIFAAIYAVYGMLRAGCLLIGFCVRRWCAKHPDRLSLSRRLTELRDRILRGIWVRRPYRDPPTLSNDADLKQESPSKVKVEPVHTIKYPPPKAAQKKYSKEYIDAYAESCNAYLELEDEKEAYKIAFEE